jgi:hypothetical protein
MRMSSLTTAAAFAALVAVGACSKDANRDRTSGGDVATPRADSAAGGAMAPTTTPGMTGMTAADSLRADSLRADSVRRATGRP